MRAVHALTRHYAGWRPLSNSHLQARAPEHQLAPQITHGPELVVPEQVIPVGQVQ
jgi:hypothetical protein